MPKFIAEQTERRTVSMTNRDREFLTALGGGNVSAGIRASVIMMRAMNEKCEFIPSIDDVETKPLKDGE